MIGGEWQRAGIDRYTLLTLRFPKADSPTWVPGVVTGLWSGSALDQTILRLEATQ